MPWVAVIWKRLVLFPYRRDRIPLIDATDGEVAAGFNAGQLVDPEAHARAAVVRRKEQEKAKLREMLRGLRAEEEELLDRRNNYRSVFSLRLGCCWFAAVGLLL